MRHPVESSHRPKLINVRFQVLFAREPAMSLFAILLGGDLTFTKRLRQQIAGARFVAADSGMKHARMLGIVPELWVGDFDSAGSELLLDYADVLRQAYPAEKDATDGEIAVNAALKLGATEIILLGGMGGQADHATAHLGLALHLAQTGTRCFISCGDEEAYSLIAGSHKFDLAAGTRLSIVPWSDIAGFTLQGVKWPLENVALRLGSSFTMSNVALGPVQLSFASGIAIAFTYPSESD
jgi:thiamine pyrophosphokinase